MVYIFFVQSGTMMTFDNEISIMQSVADLKEKIQEKCQIPIEQQVLLINGGEPLDSQKNLCSYMAGTDTNPIYLFSTNYDIAKLDILRKQNYDDSELKKRLIESLSLPVSLQTVKIRTLVAQDFFSVAKLILDFCENMVLEQHLQQQGWSAVIANLEDIVSEFRKRWDLFQKMYDEFMAERETYDSFLFSFEDDKKILQRIPVLDSLIEYQKELMDTSKLSETTTSTSETEPGKPVSLFEWISSSDSKNTLDDLFVLCKSNLKKFEKEIMPSLSKQIVETLIFAETPERKEIEGLGKRLFDLDDLLRKMKKSVEHQSDMAQSFLQNQNSVAHMKDTSILPDLCATHVQQLELIKACHQRIIDDRNRIVKAKHELSKSLCARIGWVQNVEDKLWELDSLLVYFHEHLQRLRKHLEVFQQLHLTPVTYMSAVVEVVRRRSFSQSFLTWASDLACRQFTIHNEEVARRKDFSSQFDGHFLNALFPGLGDMPPAFAIEAPPIFDAKLPQISEEDVERLRKELPDFSDILSVPEISHVVSFYAGKSVAKGKEDKVDDATAVEEKLIQAVSDAGLSSNLDKNLLKGTGSETSLTSAPGLLPLLKDDKGCESETDTEEFEKVSQSPLELTFPQTVSTGAGPSHVLEKIDASTSTEDNLQISRSEHEKLQTTFLSVSAIARAAATSLRGDLDSFKAQFVEEAGELKRHYEDLGRSWNRYLVAVEENDKQTIESMRRQYDAEKEQYRYDILEKEEVVRRLEEDKRAMEDRIRETSQKLALVEDQLAKQTNESANKIDDLLGQLREKDADKERCLRELNDNLKMEHRAELDNIKSRFKLMTMERSPSLTSLEKDKSGDFSSLPGHTTLLVQMTENFEMDKEKAVLEERQKWEKVLEERTKELQRRFEEDKQLLSQDLAKRLSQDKEKQIDVLMERERNLSLEIVKYKTTIQQLTECQEERIEDRLLCEEVEELRRKNKELQNELSRNTDVVSSSATASEESPAASLTKSQSSRSNLLNINACRVGDLVLVLWSPQHEMYTILQDSNWAYFLHLDCLATLGLSITNGRPNKIHCLGEVVGAELCESRKDDNRFKVKKGSKFFIVKAKPIAGQSDADLSQSQYVAPELFAAEGIGIIEEPLELTPRSVEQQLAQDSGIVDSVEQAAAAVEDPERNEEEEFWSMQHIPDDRDRMLNEFSEKQKQYELEISKYKSAIEQLAKPEELERLRHDNDRLNEELEKVKSEKEFLMSTSVALCDSKLDASTSPLSSPPMSHISRSEMISSSSRPNRLNIDSCKVGDVVALFWDQAHDNFKVLQESRHTYFLHSDCLDRLGLAIIEGKPNKMYCIGEVVDKEYCQTRKSENRYKVPKGAKFFRVKVKPVTALHRDSKEMSQSAYTTKQSSSMSTSHSLITTFDPVIEESHPQGRLLQFLSEDADVDNRDIEGEGRSESETASDNMLEQEDVGPRSVEKKLAEDSGIEEATVAIEQGDR